MTDARSPSASTKRKDAVRNDKRVLDAAREAFSEHGPGASMEDIARRAGVGVGTIYRRFPSKGALLETLAEQMGEELDNAAAAALADDDPGRGLAAFLHYVGEFNQEKRRFSVDLIQRVGEQHVNLATLDKVDALTRNAVTSGALGADITTRDVHALLSALHSVVASSAADDHTTWQRFVALHLRGMREAGSSTS